MDLDESDLIQAQSKYRSLRIILEKEILKQNFSVQKKLLCFDGEDLNS